LNLRDNFLARRNILATNQIARKIIEPFENNNKRSQGRLGEGGPLNYSTLNIAARNTKIGMKTGLRKNEMFNMS